MFFVIQPPVIRVSVLIVFFHDGVVQHLEGPAVVRREHSFQYLGHERSSTSTSSAVNPDFESPGLQTRFHLSFLVLDVLICNFPHQVDKISDIFCGWRFKILDMEQFAKSRLRSV